MPFILLLERRTTTVRRAREEAAQQQPRRGGVGRLLMVMRIRFLAARGTQFPREYFQTQFGLRLSNKECSRGPRCARHLSTCCSRGPRCARHLENSKAASGTGRDTTRSCHLWGNIQPVGDRGRVRPRESRHLITMGVRRRWTTTSGRRREQRNRWGEERRRRRGRHHRLQLRGRTIMRRLSKVDPRRSWTKRGRPSQIMNEAALGMIGTPSEKYGTDTEMN